MHLLAVLRELPMQFSNGSSRRSCLRYFKAHFGERTSGAVSLDGISSHVADVPSRRIHKRSVLDRAELSVPSLKPIPHGLIAFATNFFQASAVKNADLTTAIFDQFGYLQNRCGS